jgi:hypothetical protein
MGLKNMYIMRKLKLSLISLVSTIAVVVAVLLVFQNHLDVSGQQSATVGRLGITLLGGQAGEEVEMSIKDPNNQTQDQQFITLTGPSTSVSYSVPSGLTIMPGYKVCVNVNCKDIPLPDTLGISQLDFPVR